MCQAQSATTLLHAVCRDRFPEQGIRMASTVAKYYDNVLTIADSGSHKYIPTEKLNKDLGLPYGAGVSRYWLMQDDSYVLFTCDGPLAYWTGKNGSEAKWGL